MSYVATIGDTATALDMRGASGGNWSDSVTLLNSDGTPYVTTGRTYKMEVRLRQGAPLIKTVTVTPTSNVLGMSADFAAVVPCTARFDIWETVTAGGARKPLLRGFYQLLPGITEE